MKKKIQIRNLKKKFENKEILKSINLNIYESQSLAIIGESGSGKSVLVKCIAGLLDNEFGEIIIDNNYNLNDMSKINKINHISKFGFLFQNAALFDSLTVKENIFFNAQSFDSDDLLRDLGINESIFNNYPSDLSVGMQKRIGLARAILTNPEVLVLDEPTTGLDPIMSEQINKLIKRLVVKKKITTITITHDMESVYQFADKVAFIYNGSIFWYGDVEKIKSSKSLELLNFINGKY